MIGRALLRRTKPTSTEFVDAALVDRLRAWTLENEALVPIEQTYEKLFMLNRVAPMFADLPRDCRILEVGCGHGVQSALLSQFGRVSATDLEVTEAWMGTEVGRARAAVFRDLGQGNIEFMPNSGDSLPYESETFDIVYHSSVIEHVPNVLAFNRETARVLKRGGRVICTTGTSGLALFRLAHFYSLELPRQVAAALLSAFLSSAGVREAPMLALARCLAADRKRPDRVLAPSAIRALYPRLWHALGQPEYNRILIENLARESGVSIEDLWANVALHLESSPWHEVLFRLAPRTHGQHYRGAIDEAAQWSLPVWKQSFEDAGFRVEQVLGHRFDHLFLWGGGTDTSTWWHTVLWPLLRRLGERSAELSSEFVLVARKT